MPAIMTGNNNMKVDSCSTEEPAAATVGLKMVRHNRSNGVALNLVRLHTVPSPF